MFNATGLPIPMAEHLAVARRVAKHRGPMVSADQEWLLGHGVQPWMGLRSLPLWVPMPAYAGFSSRDSSAARAKGLVTRPLEDTLVDVLAWELSRESPTCRQAGLADEDERVLLAELTPAV